VTGVVIEYAHGGSRNDPITCDDADNVLQGGAGDDVISGLAGNDILNGNEGNDTLMGGAGSDVFILETKSGHDAITDFAGGHDLLDVAELGINDLI
jgi:Ca2+-binding RTX toxin-like protein